MVCLRDIEARTHEDCRAVGKKNYSSHVLFTSDLIKQKDGQEIVWG